MHKLLATRGLVTYIKVAPRCRKKVQRRRMKTRGASLFALPYSPG